MYIEGNLYIVYRKYPQPEEFGYNRVFVCAQNENQAKGIALAECSSLCHESMEESKRDILVKKIEEVKIGDALCTD